MRLLFGLDIGGTNIKAGVVDEAGTILIQDSVKTHADTNSAEDILSLGVELFNKLTTEIDVAGKISAIGVGSPGVVHKDRRRIVRAFNLPFNNLDAASYLEEKLQLPVIVGNDANLAALAESRIGAGKGAVSSITVTLGTGYGGGIVINDRVYSGFNGAGCELGHTLLVEGGEPCSCGRNGCIEAYCAAPALIRQTKEAGEKDPDSKLGQYVAAGHRVSGRTAFDFAADGCETAAGVIDRYVRHNGEALANFINSINPERIMVGGGISHQGPEFIAAIEKVALEEAFLFDLIDNPVILPATLGNDAGIVGAAMFALDALDDAWL
ncbi:MAG TPA: ROK family protein [Fastidiosipila sp.]|jgi:glucokinase|nr:ROK family protein [Fastidiosipila sp.]